MYNIGDIVPFKGKLYRIVSSESGTCEGCSLFDHAVTADIKMCNGINDLVHNRCSKKIYVEIKDMKKSDLQTGMVVQTKSGHRFFVFRQGEKVNLFNNQNYCGKSLQDDLTNSADSNLDIVEVFQPEKIYHLAATLATNNSIWKREETVELTLQDIANKFNVSVDKIRIKEKI